MSKFRKEVMFEGQVDLIDTDNTPGFGEDSIPKIRDLKQGKVE